LGLALSESKQWQSYVSLVILSIPLIILTVPLETAASFWFEIWGSWILVKKIQFSREISEKFRFFSGNFTKEIRFSRQIFKKFRFFQAISQKISIL